MSCEIDFSDARAVLRLYDTLDAAWRAWWGELSCEVRGAILSAINKAEYEDGFLVDWNNFDEKTRQDIKRESERLRIYISKLHMYYYDN